MSDIVFSAFCSHSLKSKAIAFEVRQAINGQEEIALWQSWSPHLIWMDMRMPLMNGFEATKQIKAAGDHSLARTNRLTSYDAAYLELAMREGVPLATLDQDLKRAASKLGIVLL